MSLEQLGRRSPGSVKNNSTMCNIFANQRQLLLLNLLSFEMFGNQNVNVDVGWSGKSSLKHTINFLFI